MEPFSSCLSTITDWIRQPCTLQLVRMC